MATKVNTINGIEDIRSECVNVNFDEVFFRKQRLEFYMLTSLGTRSMYNWLPSNSIVKRGAKTIELGGTSFAIRTHVKSNIPWLQQVRRENKELSKTLRQLKGMVNTAEDALRTMKKANGNDHLNDNFSNQSQLLESLTGMLQQKVKILAMQPPSYQFFVGNIRDGVVAHSPNPIFDAFKRENPRLGSDMEAIEHLEKVFDCKGESIWSPVRVDRRSNWRQRLEGVTGHKPFFHPTNHTVLLNLNARNLPVTSWTRVGDGCCYQLSVFPSPLPIYNFPPSTQPDVYLTDNLTYALYRHLPDSSAPISVSSWIGQADSIPFVNWACLKNMTVKYLLLCGEKSHLQTAAKVKNALDGIVAQFDFMGVPKYRKSSVATNGLQKIELHDFERLLEGKVSDYHVCLSGSNTGSKRRALRAPFSTVTDTNIISKPPLQSPFPIGEGSISMLYSEPGIGKTWFAMCFSYAVSLQQAFCRKWKSNKKKVVLYIDGEMGEAGLQDRLQHIEKIYGVKLKDNRNFHCLALNVADIDLASIEGQHEIDKYISENINAHGKKELLIVIDNILSVTQYSDHAAHWNSIFGWAKDLRDNDNATIMFIHHTNKSGIQRGSGIKTAVVDNVIRIKPPANENSDIRMEFDFEKHRFIAYNDPELFDLSVKLHVKRPRWIDHGKYSTDKDSSLLDRLLRGCNSNERLPIEKLMEETGYSRAAIYKRYKEICTENKGHQKTEQEK